MIFELFERWVENKHFSIGSGVPFFSEAIPLRCYCVTNWATLSALISAIYSSRGLNYGGFAAIRDVHE